MTLALTQVVLGLVPHLRDPDVSVEEMEVHAENAVRITYLWWRSPSASSAGPSRSWSAIGDGGSREVRRGRDGLRPSRS